MKGKPLPPAGWTQNPGDWPRVFLVGARDCPAPGDLRCWMIRFRAWFEGGRRQFMQRTFEGGWLDAKEVRLELRRRAAAEGIERIELFDVAGPPSLDTLLAIEEFNRKMEVEKAQAAWHDTRQARAELVEASK